MHYKGQYITDLYLNMYIMPPHPANCGCRGLKSDLATWAVFQVTWPPGTIVYATGRLLDKFGYTKM